MTHDEVLRRVCVALDLGEDRVAEVCALVDLDPGEIAATDASLARFLDGLILDRRGPSESGEPAPVDRLSANMVFKKLRIAMSLHEPDVLSMLAAGGMSMTKRELSPLFRKPGSKNYKRCSDEVLGAFLSGLTLRRVSQSAE